MNYVLNYVIVQFRRIQMSYQIEKLEKNQVKLTFDVESQDWKDAIAQAYNKMKNKFTVEGFRKGKVPQKVVERMYGVGIFFDDALDIIIPKYIEDALSGGADVAPVARPDIDIVAISDSTLKFTATFQETPDVELGQYKGLEFKKKAVKVTNDEVDEAIKKDQDKLTTWEKVEGRAAEDGDKVIIDYSGSVDGVKFEGGTAENQELTLGSHMFIPGFEEQVVGMNVGESKDITVKFPADYGVDTLADKDAVFAIKLHEIEKKVVPALDDEFVKDVSETANTVAEDKKEIKENIKARKESEAEIELENEMIETIAKSSKVEIPDVMIDAQTDDMVYEFEYRLQYQGLNIDDYYKYTNSNRDQLKSQYVEQAKKSVLMRLVMESIIKAEKIEATDEEVDNKLRDFAKGANKDFDEYKKSVVPGQLNYIKNQIVTDKLLAFLKANNKFN